MWTFREDVTICLLSHYRKHFWCDISSEGRERGGGGGGGCWVCWRSSSTRSRVFDVTAGDCKNEGWHRAPASSAVAGHPVSLSVSQSVPEIPNSVYSCVINVGVCVCVSPCLSSGNRSGRSDSVAWPSVSRPAKWRACQPSWQTLSSCWPTMAAANVGHVLWQSDTAYTTTRLADRTRAVKFDARGVNARALRGWGGAAVISAQLETPHLCCTSLSLWFLNSREGKPASMFNINVFKAAGLYLKLTVALKWKDLCAIEIQTV